MMTGGDAFYLTPHDVRSQEFSRGMRGYEKSQVDEFRERIANELDRLLRDRAQLDERLRGLNEQLASFRDREKAMNEALISAQQLRTDAKTHVEKEAEIILREAHAEAKKIVEQAKSDERQARKSAEVAAKQAAAYVAGFRSFVERHLSEIRLLEDHADTGRAFMNGSASESK